ncbi:MAG: hypothetical protein Q9162_007007 [Coniocarpon cinnabarinum]
MQHCCLPLLDSADLHQAIALTLSQSLPSIQQPSKAITGAIESVIRAVDFDAFFREYRPLPVLTSWMQLLQSLFPSMVDLLEVGHSWEGQPISAVKVGVRRAEYEASQSPRKTVLVTGGSHAREWISVSSVAYSLHNFLLGYGSDSDITTVLEELDFIFVPTQNPDGYKYTWEHDRLWRKTRQPGPIPFCQGMDIDSSFSFQWDPSAGSRNPCSEHYAGEKPFHSVEAASFSQWLKNQTLDGRREFVSMIDLHSYSQQILVPYAYSCDSEPTNEEDLEELAAGMARAIKRTSGEYYEVVSACRENVILSQDNSGASHSKAASNSGGSPLDWFHHDLGARYSYQIKLRDTGNYGFLLPPENIVPVGSEMFNAILFLGKFLISDDSAGGD